MRSYRTIIEEAQLLASPPETVAEFLKRYAKRLKNEPLNSDVDEGLEGGGSQLARQIVLCRLDTRIAEIEIAR